MIDEPHKKILERYCAQLRDSRAVLLIGAGASMPPPSSRPNWRQMLEKMATVMEEYSTAAAALMRELASDGKLLDAAHVFAIGDKIPKSARAKFFLDEFGTGPADVPDVCRDLAALDAMAWITTNYDNNLRYALSTRAVESYGNDETDLQAAHSFMGERLVLVQIHGKAGTYDSLVYDTSTYANIPRSEPYELLLRKLFSSLSVLAFGFSFDDPPFQAALRAYPSRPHAFHVITAQARCSIAT